ncbi:MAG: (d)CMP kinase, partial [Lachnospiraceae bacterium]|nr:(d)CMP kinase [Lachnospiraceae bacterium]
PAGAGKSTIAKMAAERLGFVYVDTGAMYRALALYFVRLGIKPEEKEKIKQALPALHITLTHQDGEQVVLLDGENVNDFIRTQEVGSMASCISPLPAVREKLLFLQRELAKRTSVIMDGRDIGTVVLPDADIKIYLTADPGVRAKRRCLELEAKGEACDEGEILREIIARDEQDMTREISPLKKAEDAVVLDASELTAEEVTERLVALIRERCEGCR